MSFKGFAVNRFGKRTQRYAWNINLIRQILSVYAVNRHDPVSFNPVNQASFSVNFPSRKMCRQLITVVQYRLQVSKPPLFCFGCWKSGVFEFLKSIRAPASMNFIFTECSLKGINQLLV